jgi:signal transduction histidine kinase
MNPVFVKGHNFRAGSPALKLASAKRGMSVLNATVDFLKNAVGFVPVEDQMRAQAAEIERLRAELGAARRDSIGDQAMIADLSHEMKTPLNAVIGFAEAISEETFGPVGNDKYADYARNISQSGRHLLDLVTAMLDLAQLDAGRLELKPEPSKIAALLKECAEMVRVTAEEAGLTLNVTLDEDLPDCAVDRRAFRQIVLNLLSNAVKFTSAGKVMLTARRDGERLVVEVRDTGVGMSADEIARIGGRFTDIKTNGVRGVRGAGLGLSLALALAEAHGGRIDFSSAPGAGLTAAFTLPVRNADASLPSANKSAAHKSATPTVMTQLERIEAYRREVLARRAAEARKLESRQDTGLESPGTAAQAPGERTRPRAANAA